MEASTHRVRIGSDHRLELVLPEMPEGSIVNVTIEPEWPFPAGFQRRPGSAAGKIRIMPNFDDPLEEFEDEKY